MLNLPRNKVKLFINILVVLTIFLSSIGFFIYSGIRELVVSDLGKNTASLSKTIAAFIEEDIEPFDEIIKVGDYQKGNYDSDYYTKMNSLFQRIKQETGATFVYVEKRVSSKEMAYVFDGESPESENFSPIGTPEMLTDYHQKVIDEGRTVTTDVIYWEGWGKYLTSFAPIKNHKTGEILGVVGVDFSQDYVKGILNIIILTIIIGMAILTLLTSLLIFRLINDRWSALNQDYLTQMHSKRYYKISLDDLINKADKKEFALSLMMIDLDNFKVINDMFGHVAGDQVLKLVANTIKETIRRSDICSRYGGDEFVVILSNTSIEQAKEIADRLISQIKNIKQSMELPDGIKEISISIGISQWQEGIDAKKLTQQTDEAMYVSKRKGQNQITAYDKI